MRLFPTHPLALQSLHSTCTPTIRCTLPPSHSSHTYLHTSTIPYAPLTSIPLSALSSPPLACINVPALAHLLHSHPDQPRTQYLLDGLTHGFPTGFHGEHWACHACNLPSAAARPQVITQYILKECAAGHSLGPFLEPLLHAFVVNPLGAVPKKQAGTLRLIMHLSFPPGDSVNDGISVSDFPLRYSTVYDAMDSVMHLGRHALMAKIDVTGTFRLCPIHPADHHLLGYQWQGRYYYDGVLHFGLRSAPYIFNCLADAIEWLVRQRGITQVHHYLADFFIAGSPRTPECARHL